MFEKFTRICQMTQLAVKNYVEFELKKTHTDITVGDGFVFAKGTFPVLLVAHMDTVHDELPYVLEYDEEFDAVSSPNGIGGDDRCGIYMILEIIQKHNCSVLFCEDEETGCIGARKFTKTDLAKELKFNYIIEFDRKGNKDAVFYDCANDDFEEFITKEFYETAYGSLSDISIVAPFLGCAAVNLSCGYYSAHTKKEYVVLQEMERSIEEACKILERTTENDKFEYIESPYTSYYGGYYGSYYGSYSKYGSSKWSSYKGNSSKASKGSSTNKNYIGYNSGWYDDDDEDLYTRYYLIEYTDAKGKTDWFETYAVSEAEAVGRFLMMYPGLCYNNIIDIMTV